MAYAHFDQLKGKKNLRFFYTYFRPIKGHCNNFEILVCTYFYQLKYKKEFMFRFVHTFDQIKDMKTVSDFYLYTLRGAVSKTERSH